MPYSTKTVMAHAAIWIVCLTGCPPEATEQGDTGPNTQQDTDVDDTGIDGKDGTADTASPMDAADTTAPDDTSEPNDTSGPTDTTEPNDASDTAAPEDAADTDERADTLVPDTSRPDTATDTSAAPDATDTWSDTATTDSGDTADGMTNPSDVGKCPAPSPPPQGVVCIQVVSCCTNSSTGQRCCYPTPCHIPEEVGKGSDWTCN